MYDGFTNSMLKLLTRTETFCNGASSYRTFDDVILFMRIRLAECVFYITQGQSLNCILSCISLHIILILNKLNVKSSKGRANMMLNLLLAKYYRSVIKKQNSSAKLSKDKCDILRLDYPYGLNIITCS